MRRTIKVNCVPKQPISNLHILIDFFYCEESRSSEVSFQIPLEHFNTNTNNNSHQDTPTEMCGELWHAYYGCKNCNKAYDGINNVKFKQRQCPKCKVMNSPFDEVSIATIAPCESCKKRKCENNYSSKS